MTQKNADEKIALRREYYMFLYQRIIFDLILTPFTSLLTCRTPERIVETFDRLIRLLGFPSNIININNRDIGIGPFAKRGMLKRDIRAFTLLKDLLNISHREMRLAQRLFDIEKSDILLASFYKAFINRINNKYLLDERNPDVIRVSQWLETRGRSFEYVFAGGLTASRFPLKDEPDFIIPESSRGLFRIIDPVDYSKHLFSNLLKNYRKGLYLSFPENISEKPVQPSQVIQDLYDIIKTGAGPEKSNRWNENPFYTSGNDLLNAGKDKNKEQDGGKHIPMFNLKDIIIRDHSSEEDIIRGIKTIASRSAANGLFEYDGQVGDASGFKEFIKETGKTFSSSRLETLANCPMKYLFRYVYRIQDIDEITPEASSRDLGQFVHDILKMIFKELADIKKNIAGIGLDRAIAMAGEIISACIGKRSVLERLDFGEYHKLELFTGIGNETLPDGGMDSREGVIHALLRYENAEFINRVPAGVEFEFGTGDKPVSMGNIFIKGFIDRFDRDINSQETVYIYDYKTGYIKPAANIKKGLAFQLPVYIRALESIIKPGAISAASYSVKRSAFLENAPLKNHVTSGFSGSGLDISGVSLIDDFIRHLARLMEKGSFHQSADGLTCEYCTFRYACHKNNRRIEYLLEACAGSDIYSGAKNLARWQEADNFKKEWKTICQSMEKAKTLKTESAKKRHYETVMDFYYGLEHRRDSLPFTSKYLDSLVGELDRFRAGYNS